jgi:hypothetical protein
MDWAAEFHFLNWIEKTDSRFAESARHHGQALADEFVDRSPDGRFRTTGRRCADSLYRWLRRKGLTDHAARLRTARLAVHVNLATTDLKRKDQLTETLLDPPSWLESELSTWIRKKKKDIDRIDAEGLINRAWT